LTLEKGSSGAREGGEWGGGMGRDGRGAGGIGRWSGAFGVVTSEMEVHNEEFKTSNDGRKLQDYRLNMTIRDHFALLYIFPYLIECII